MLMSAVFGQTWEEHEANYITLMKRMVGAASMSVADVCLLNRMKNDYDILTCFRNRSQRFCLNISNHGDILARVAKSILACVMSVFVNKDWPSLSFKLRKINFNNFVKEF